MVRREENKKLICIRVDSMFKVLNSSSSLNEWNLVWISNKEAEKIKIKQISEIKNGNPFGGNFRSAINYYEESLIFYVETLLSKIIYKKVIDITYLSSFTDFWG